MASSSERRVVRMDDREGTEAVEESALGFELELEIAGDGERERSRESDAKNERRRIFVCDGFTCG